jgi:hypothetical protein
MNLLAAELEMHCSHGSTAATMAKGEAMALIPEPNQEKPTRVTLEKAFATAEASLRLEGMAPTDVYFSVKERVLAGEITFDQAAEEINAHHAQLSEGGSMTSNIGRPESVPTCSPATWKAPTSETAKNPEEEAAQEAGRRILELAGTMPEIEDVRRLRVNDFLDAVEKTSNAGHHRMPDESRQISTEEADYDDDLRRADPDTYYKRVESIDPMLRKLAETDPEAFLRHLEASYGLAAAGGTEPDLEDIPRRRLPRR